MNKSLIKSLTIITILALASVFLTACNEPDEKIVANGAGIKTVCIDNVRYVIYLNRGITAKFNTDSKVELCNN